MISYDSFMNLKICGEPVSHWKKSYSHEDRQDAEKNKLILCDGEYERYDTVFAKVFDAKQKKLSSEWRYDRDGFAKKSFIKFRELTPTHHRENPERLYYFVIKTKEAGFLGLSRHCYMELIDAEGNGFSYGLCGSDSYPFCGKKGAIVSPDPREATKGIERRTRIIINEDKFAEIKATIQADKEYGYEYFHFFNHNCSTYTAHVAERHLGLKIDNREFISQSLMRNMFERINFHPGQTVLKIIHIVGVIFRAVLSPFYLLLWLLTGAPFDTEIGKQTRLKQSYIPKVSLFQQTKDMFWSFINADYFKLSTGWKMSVWQNRVNLQYQDNTITLDQAQNISVNDPIALSIEPRV